MYGKWEQLLSQEAQINWNEAHMKLRACNNEAGIYPDVGYLLFRFANEPSIQTVLEMGSGLSTFILAWTCLQLNSKELVTFESEEKWSKPPLCLLEAYGIDPSFYRVTENQPTPVFPEGKQWDMAWVDGHVTANTGAAQAGAVLNRVDACLYYEDHLKHAILMFDDAQRSKDIQGVVPKIGRSLDDTVWFNPSGRMDRHILISFPVSDHPLLPLVEKCK
jgi:hypothetical protein